VFVVAIPQKVENESAPEGYNDLRGQEEYRA